MLQIHNVQLENFCQHDFLSLDFNGGITVILGPNGSGKSNLTNGIYSALTGSFNRGPGDATKCIGPAEEGGCSVQVTGSVHDRRFWIRREVRRGRDGQGKVGHALWLDDETHKTYKTAGEIESWLEDATGLSTDILSYFLFPGQLGLSGYATGRASERAEKFAALCGTRRYRQIRETYMKRLNEDRKRYDKSCATLEYLGQAIRSAESNCRSIDESIVELKERIGPVDLKRLLEKLESESEEIAAAKTRIEEKEKQLAALEKEHAIRKGHYEGACHDYDAIEQSIAANEKKRRKLSGQLDLIRQNLSREIGAESYEHLTDRLTEQVAGIVRLCKPNVKTVVCHFDPEIKPRPGNDSRTDDWRLIRYLQNSDWIVDLNQRPVYCLFGAFAGTYELQWIGFEASPNSDPMNAARRHLIRQPVLNGRVVPDVESTAMQIVERLERPFQGDLDRHRGSGVWDHRCAEYLRVTNIVLGIRTKY